MCAPFLRRSRLLLGSCQGSGLDSGMGGMKPPVSNPGAIGANGMGGGMGAPISGSNNNMSGPTIGANGQAELANPGATLAPNEAQYAISQGPSGMKCPTVLLYSQQYGCNLAFNIPSPSPGAKWRAERETDCNAHAFADAEHERRQRR